MKNKENTHISLVGAGPGDVELISVKGLNRLKKAKVVLYDALVNEELLTYAPTARKIFVGKRKGFKTYEQEQINQLMIDCANEFGDVVRLKGGDSFVFGRGMEEIIFAKQHHITTEVIPGISSSISVPALANIPVTHRGMSNSFFVLSATLSDGSLNPELKKAADLDATVVILMGLSQVEKIADLFHGSGKSQTPVAVIYNGSLPEQKTIVGTIETISGLHEQAAIKGPGVIVIGEVVSFASADPYEFCTNSSETIHHS
ncbi:MAG: uroporphyrinogen-III C-methyltransferase [Fluviicola sp.]|jgi:uroporphyrin-III C-methyltransferase|uniref:uroporphyrinogen-III C-methyltransferase n=1 Tax=Fluviicola sp. TaxID=1917219 RepID=UPI002637986C|nr:uroporphyrinogen-III C-methyltransferase [Fluviicola sp.]MDF3025907.1 uroporphyrinogen-III C-methyltransferase [Fluviicola sp.]